MAGEAVKLIAAVQFQQPDRYVETARERRAPVRRYGDAAEPFRTEPADPDRLPGPGVPQPNGAVEGAGEDLLAIGREHGGADRFGMTFEFAKVLAGREIPQVDVGGVARQQGATIRRKLDPIDHAEIADNCLHHLSGRQLPDLDRPVEASRHRPETVRREFDTSDPVRVPAERPQ